MYIDEDKAERAIKFTKQLCHTKGKWRNVPFTMLPWQSQVAYDIFGTMRDEGFRQYTMVYMELPKKMGKSEYAAAVALQGLCADGEWAAEVYGCAADRAQASLVFDVAVDMVDQNTVLRKKIKPILSQKRLVYLPSKSFYQVLSAEAYSKHGLNVSRVIFDEIHAQPNRDLFDVMTEGSGDARTQPLYFCISTAGDDPNRDSIGWEVHKMAVDVLTGVKKDPTFYAMIYGLDRDNRRIWKGREFETITTEVEDDKEWRKIWQDKKVWEAVNPSIGHTVLWDKVEDQFTRARGNLAKEKNFRWLRLNCWEKLKTSKWLGLDFWDRCNGKINNKNLSGRPCYGGLDLSTKIDMTAFVLLFPPDDINRHWTVLPRFWIPEDNMRERASVDKVPYLEWHQKGYLQITKGNAIDYDYIEKEIMEAMRTYHVHQIGYDEWNAMQTAIHMQDEGAEMVPVRQGYKSMSPSMKEIEQLVRAKKLVHGGHPVLRWNVSNVEVKSDENENIRPVKGKGTERIDGLVALINAMFCAIRHEDPTSKYETEEMMII